MSENQHSSPEPVDRSSVLAFLATLERDMDPILLKARTQYPGPTGWFGSLLLRSLLGLKYKKMSDESIQKMTTMLFSNHYMVWVAFGTAIFGTAVNQWGTWPWLQHFQPWPRTIGIGWLIITWLLSLKANYTRMLTLDDPYFTPVAYKFFRPKEYSMFINYLKGSKDTIGNVREWVKLLYNENSLDAIISEHRLIHDALRDEIQGLKRELKNTNNNLRLAESEIDSLVEKAKLLLDQVTTNEDNLRSAIDILYRMRKREKSLFGLNDLRLISNFSLFELVGDDLYMIGEQGTTETPDHIKIHDPYYAHYSSVILVQSGEMVEFATSDREGRTVASYWIEVPSDRVFIYNFHYDSTNDKIRDIIESKEMYRFIRIICMLLDERGLLMREGAQDAES